MPEACLSQRIGHERRWVEQNQRPGIARDALRGVSIDVLTLLRTLTFGDPHPASASPTVVVALDEETFRTTPFEGSPSVTWTPEIGRVLNAVIAGGSKVVGFDVVFATSIEQSAVPFGDDTLGARLRGFDRDYLRALALGARAGKVVLGEVQLGSAGRVHTRWHR